MSGDRNQNQSQIALDEKAENARELGLDYEPAKDVFADMPEAIPFVTQDELEKLIADWIRKNQ
jgi:hypothetical protein